jgi:hypothetical protein
MCRRFIHARAQRSDLAKLFSVDCEKKTFLSERNVLHFLTREEYLFTSRVERDRQRKRKKSQRRTPHTREVVCTFLSFLPPERYMCAD